MSKVRKQHKEFWFFFLLITALAVFFIYQHSRGPRQVAHPQWVTDFENARTTAAEQNKDLFLFFTSSDWCPWCVRLDREVLTDATFVTPAQEDFIFVKVDFPRNRSGQSQELQQQNAELAARYAVQGYPTVVLADAEGNSYARTGYQPGGGAAYLEHVRQLKK